ncbi:MAG: ornithine carbamoyltransferase [Candidatus Omnitrophica bacterium]|nr:ornithine carbamoyltransferase [Candidatus Omnitrophota bacterium]
MKKDLVSIKDLSNKDVADIFELTAKLKKNKAKFTKVLSGKTLALVFQKPSNRTRVSFEVGMYQLGGNSFYLAPHEVSIGVRESVQDVAKTLSRYVDGIVLRTFEHKNILEMADASRVPVINGLSDFSHPCQGLADVYTIKEKFKKIKGVTLAYVGDGNNVCTSLVFAAARTGLHLNIASPCGYEPKKEVLDQAKKVGGSIRVTSDAALAVKGADVVYTDVWASMGKEDQAQERKKIFKPYQLNSSLLRSAKKGCLVMHCLPAHRGQEITDEVIDGKNSIVFDQAENRMHVQKAILIKLLNR